MWGLFFLSMASLRYKPSNGVSDSKGMDILVTLTVPFHSATNNVLVFLLLHNPSNVGHCHFLSPLPICRVRGEISGLLWFAFFLLLMIWTILSYGCECFVIVLLRIICSYPLTIYWGMAIGLMHIYCFYVLDNKHLKKFDTKIFPILPLPSS